MKRFTLCLLTLLMTGTFAAGNTPVTLDQLQLDALRTAPDLDSLRRRIEAARAAAEQAGRRPNPQVSLFVDSEEQEITVTQTLDFWGKLPIARRIALTHADETAAKLVAARLELLHEVARHFWTLAGAQRRLALLEEELDDWQKLLAIRKGELEAGEIATIDLLAAQSLVAQRRQERWTLLAGITSARTALNVLTGRRADEALEIKTSATVKTSGEPATAPEAINRALVGNPVLARIRAQLDAAGFRVQQEERGWKPDPKIGPIARQSSEETFIGFTLSFSLPVFDKNRAGIHAAKSSVDAVQADLRSAELALVQEAFIAFQQRSQARDAFRELSELISGPATRQRQLAEETFELGGISERDLLAVRIEWNRQEQELETLKTRIGLADARLARVLATD